MAAIDRGGVASFGVDWGTVDSGNGLDRSWTSVLKPGEYKGGPSPCGNSWWSEFLRCPRAFQLAHIKGLTTTGYEQPLEVGGLFHECVAIYFDALKFKNPLATEWHEAASSATVKVNDLLDRTAIATPIVTAEARNLWLAWFRQYGPDGYTPLTAKVFGVELMLSNERLSDRWTFPYSARLDTVLWGPVGPVIRELKTARAMTSDLLTGYELSGQFLGQAYLWQKLEAARSGKLRGFQVDLVIKTKSPTLEGLEVKIEDKNIRNWCRSMQSHYVDMLKCRETGFWPQNHNSCVSWSRNSIMNKQCKFHEFCATNGKSMNGLRKKKRTEW